MEQSIAVGSEVAVRSTEPRRRWRTVEEKRRIVEEAMVPGASVAQVARLHGVNANQVFAWRRQYQAGELVTAGTSGPKLLPVIRSFFDSISHEWLIRFVEHRIGDPRIIRLIRKWLRAGVLEQGVWKDTVQGTPQGAVISPLLANIYLHYAYDLWAQAWRKRHVTGDMIIVRYADDTIVGFQHRQQAEQFLSDLRERLAKFALDLHPEKTRLIEFGRFAAERRAKRGEGKPETFDFLGFTHICAVKREDRSFQLRRKTMCKRKQAFVNEVSETLRRHRHAPIDEQGRWLSRYCEVTTCTSLCRPTCPAFEQFAIKSRFAGFTAFNGVASAN